MENDCLDDPDKDLINDSLCKEVQRALATLTQREADVIRLYFGLNVKRESLTLEEIGERFDLTRERVRQIKVKALQHLRHQSKSQDLRFYL